MFITRNFECQSELLNANMKPSPNLMKVSKQKMCAIKFRKNTDFGEMI